MTTIWSASLSASSRYCVVSSTVVPSSTNRRSRPTGRSGCEGQDRWSARRGTAPAGGGPAPPPGRAGGASHPSTCAPADQRRRTGRTARAARGAAAHDPVGQVRQQPDETQVLRPVRFSSTAANWPARPMDSRTAWGSSSTSTPSTTARPASRRSTVVIRTAVVLPAPLYQQPEDPARRHGEVDTPERHHLAEPLLQPLDQDRIISHSASVPPCADASPRPTPRQSRRA